jgi:hypothetical protein
MSNIDTDSLNIREVRYFFFLQSPIFDLDIGVNYHDRNYHFSSVTILKGCPVAFLCSVAVSLSGN